MTEFTLDASGKKCPMPVLLTKKELKKMNTGDLLHLIADDKGVLSDVPALLHKTGDKIIKTEEEEERVTMVIEKA